MTVSAMVSELLQKLPEIDQVTYLTEGNQQPKTY